jgi:hypothetical protein
LVIQRVKKKEAHDRRDHGLKVDGRGKKPLPYLTLPDQAWPHPA